MSIPFHEQDGLNSRHLAIVRRRANAQKGRLRETGDRREANQSSDKEEDFLKLERLDTYENHGSYGNYKQQPCQDTDARLSDSAVFVAGARTKGAMTKTSRQRLRTLPRLYAVFSVAVEERAGGSKRRLDRLESCSSWSIAARLLATGSVLDQLPLRFPAANFSQA